MKLLNQQRKLLEHADYFLFKGSSGRFIRFDTFFVGWVSVVAISGLTTRLAIDPGLLDIHTQLKPIAIIQQVVLDL
jgi:hypothetical protein